VRTGDSRFESGLWLLMRQASETPTARSSTWIGSLYAASQEGGLALGRAPGGGLAVAGHPGRGLSMGRLPRKAETFARKSERWEPPQWQGRQPRDPCHWPATHCEGRHRRGPAPAAPPASADARSGRRAEARARSGRPRTSTSRIGSRPSRGPRAVGGDEGQGEGPLGRHWQTAARVPQGGGAPATAVRGVPAAWGASYRSGSRGTATTNKKRST